MLLDKQSFNVFLIQSPDAALVELDSDRGEDSIKFGNSC